MRPHNEARHRMSGGYIRFGSAHRSTPLIGGLDSWATDYE